MTDWDEIRNACVENGESLKSLAERYGVSYGALRKRASREGWRRQTSRQERETAKREEIEDGVWHGSRPASTRERRSTSRRSRP